MTAAIAPHRASIAGRWPILPVLAGAGIFLASWLVVFQLNAALPVSEAPWVVWNLAMVVTATASVALLCHSRAAAATAATLSAAAVLLSFAGLEDIWPVGPLGRDGPLLSILDDLPTVLLGNRYFPPELLLTGAFLAVAIDPRPASAQHRARIPAGAGAGIALLSLVLLVVLERLMFVYLVEGSDLARIATAAFVFVAAASATIFLRWNAALLGALAVAVGLTAIGLFLYEPILMWTGDDLRRGAVAPPADYVVRLVRDVPFSWASLVLIGSWLGILVGRRSRVAHGGPA